MSCPSPTELERAFAELLDGQEEESVVEHVETCRICQGTLEALLADGEFAPRRPVEMADQRVASGTSAKGPTTDGLPAASAAGVPPDAGPEVPGYQILGVLGQGGMGVVYKARHQKLKRVVALKMILAGEHAGADKLARFQLEAQAVARLRHPNIVQIHDIGFAKGMPYIALEYLPGASLEQRSQRGPWLPRAGAELLAALAQATHTAYLADIVHRDLKPANVLFAEDGTAKITDFGLAKRLDSQGQTLTGQIIGTPAYMAPEQAKGESRTVGPAADIYALGAILYEVLTGKPPFRGETVMQTLQSVLDHEPVPPRKLVPAVPADLETVCLKALRKQPHERYATAQEFADELNRFLHDEPVRARPLRRTEKAYRWCRRYPTLTGLLLVGLALLLMVGVASTLGYYYLGLQREHERAEAAVRRAQHYQYINTIHLADRAYHDNLLAQTAEMLRECPDHLGRWEWHYLDRISHAELLQATGHTQAVHSLAFAPHGRWLVSGSADRTLAFWDAGTGRMLRRLHGHTGPIWGVVVSPDGRRLASLAGSTAQPGELIVWELTDEAIPQARPAFSVQHQVGERAALAFHPARPLLAVATGLLLDRPGQVLVLDACGNQVGSWAEMAAQGCVALAWSKDGRELAASFVSLQPSGPSGQVVICGSDTGKAVHRFIPPSGEALALAYSNDGRTLATGDKNSLIHLWDTGDHTLRQTLRGHTAGVTALAFTAGDRLLSASKDTTVRAWDARSGKALFLRRGHHQAVRCIATHPVTGQIYSGSDDLYIRAWRPDKPQEGEAYALHQGPATAVAFSPDGATLVSIGLDGAVWLTDPLGREQPRKLRDEPRPLRQVRFLPATRTMLVAGGIEEPGRDDGTVRLVDVGDGSVSGELTTGLSAAFSLSLSRDGRWLSVAGRTPEKKTVVQVWNMTSRRQQAVIPLDGSAIAAQLYAGGRKLIVLLDKVDRLQEPSYLQFDLSDEVRPLRFPYHQQRGGRFAIFTKDESLMIGGGSTSGLYMYGVLSSGAIVWDVALQAHAGSIYNAGLSPDEKIVATASEDETVRLWDLEARRELLVLYGDHSPMNDVAFSPTGEFLAAAQANGTIRVWDGRPRLPASDHAALK